MADILFIVPLSLLIILVIFQILLAGGAPLGPMAWGGQHQGRLPVLLRLASAVTVLFLFVGIVCVLRLGGIGPDIVDSVPLAFARGFLWFLTGVMVFSIVGNAATSSAPERAFGLPMTIAMTASLLGLLLMS